MPIGRVLSCWFSFTRFYIVLLDHFDWLNIWLVIFLLLQLLQSRDLNLGMLYFWRTFRWRVIPLSGLKHFRPFPAALDARSSQFIAHYSIIALCLNRFPCRCAFLDDCCTDPLCHLFKDTFLEISFKLSVCLSSTNIPRLLFLGYSERGSRWSVTPIVFAFTKQEGTEAFLHILDERPIIPDPLAEISNI